jgi:AraC family transcriptional regulator
MAVMTITRQPTAAYGEQMAKYLRLRNAESLVISPAAKQAIAPTRFVSEVGLSERTESIPFEKAFVVSIHLTPASDRGCEIWVDDKYSKAATWPSGGVGIYNLESNLRKRNPGPVDWVHYHIPRSTLDAFTDDAERPRIESLRCLYGTVDPVLHRMTQMVLPSLQDPHRFC